MSLKKKHKKVAYILSFTCDKKEQKKYKKKNSQ